MTTDLDTTAPEERRSMWLGIGKFLCGEITGPMAQYAGTTYTIQQSLDIVSYLLQQNGMPSGNQPLADTRELSEVLAAK